MTRVHSSSFRIAILVLAIAVVAVSVTLSISLGAIDIPFSQVWPLLFSPDDSDQSLIVHTLRLPRTVIALLAGAGLAVSGLILQAVTRNQLADSGILGVEAGGAFAILLMVVFFPASPSWAFVPAAFAGGLGAAILAYTAAKQVGVTPLRLALAGVAVASFISAGSRTITILWEDKAQAALFSLAGSVAGKNWEHVTQIAPLMGIGLLAAVAASTKLNVLALGEDVARSLGAQTERDSMLVTALGVLLAAISVSVVGPLGFVGLLIPHAARHLVGADHRWSLPLSALLGAAFLVIADVAARLVDRPAETPVGVLVAFAGAPFFVFLARQIGK